MIFFKLHSGMGNQMFQYAFGMLVKKERNLPVFFYVDKKEDFKLFYFEGVNVFVIPKWGSNIYIYLIRNILRYKSYLSCLDEISIDNIPNFSLIEGYFQSSKLLEENQADIYELFKIKSKYFYQYQTFQNSQIDNCFDNIIHVRKGDYKNTVFSEINSSALLPDIWYNSIISKEFLNNCYFVSDEPKAIQNLSGFRSSQNFSNSEIIDFLIILNAKNIIISNSSFAWWSAFLNTNPSKRVFAPMNWVGYFVGFEYPKGIMIDQFIWIK